MNIQIVSTRKGAYYLAIILFIIITVVTALLFYGQSNYAILQGKNYFTDELVFEKRLKIGEQFTLAYIHSITNQPVYEVFEIESNEILSLIEMRYDSFGANLPVGPEKLAEETTQFIVEDGYYKIVYENRKFNNFLLRTGQVVADHRLIFADETELRFLDIVKGGTSVEFSVRPLLSKKQGGG